MTELTADQTVVIVGAGQAGGTCAMELHKKGFEGRIVIIADEDYIPYKRPPLSKTYLSGEATLDSLYVMKAEKLEAAGIECLTNTKVESINRENKSVILSNGEPLSYDKLVLTTGGRPRPLPVEGAEADNVFLLRSIADVDAIKARCGEGKKIIIIGGGFIGLEVAAVAVKQGMNVTVLEGLDRVLARVASPEASAFYEKTHREAGVDLRTGAAVTGFEGSPEVTHVVLGDGSKIEADFVVVGIGLIPNTELAEAAGLEVDNGIIVDDHACTSDENIYAAGDCTNYPNLFYGRRMRLESVQNAMDQARTAADNLVGIDSVYDAQPWFWSDQYDLKLQMVGLSQGYDETVVRGNPDERSFSVFYLKDGVIISMDAISRPKDFMMSKKLIAERVAPDKAALADETVELKSFLPE